MSFFLSDYRTKHHSANSMLFKVVVYHIVLQAYLHNDTTLSLMPQPHALYNACMLRM